MQTNFHNALTRVAHTVAVIRLHLSKKNNPLLKYISSIWFDLFLAIYKDKLATLHVVLAHSISCTWDRLANDFLSNECIMSIALQTLRRTLTPPSILYRERVVFPNKKALIESIYVYFLSSFHSKECHIYTVYLEC